LDALAQHSFAGEIFITGRFNPSYTTEYVDTSFDSEFGDTSGDVYGDAVSFSNSAIFAWPKIVTLTDTPAYGTVTEAFTALATLAFTPAGEFYQLVGPTGWLDVDIVYPGHGISSFSFIDYGVTAPPPPVIDPPPPVCVTDCGGVTPPQPDICELRGLVEDIEKLGSDTMINQALVRELKTRGREIVDAWDSYRADSDRAKEAAGLPELNRRWKELKERRVRLWSRIAETPARTVDGMHAKIAFASSFNLLERADLVEGTMEDILLSAAMDYADLNGQEART
jgi:hypothetical protein